MTKKEIEKLASDLALIKKEVTLTGDNEKDWQNISKTIKDNHPELTEKLKKTSAKELNEKGFWVFSFTYGLLTQSFNKE